MTSDKNEAIRGVLLAALMVVSVFAVTVSPAAADVATGDRAVEDVAPGETTTVTVTAEMDADGGALTLNESFSGEVQDASIVNATINGQEAGINDYATTAANSEGAVVSLQDLPADASVEIYYTITATNNEGDITVDGRLTGGNATVQLGTSTITVGQQSTPTPTPTPTPAPSDQLFEPEMTQVSEDEGNFYVSFNGPVKNATTGNSLEVDDGNFVIYARQAGTEGFARVEVGAADVTRVSGSAAQYRIDESAHPLGDVSPASEVLITIPGDIRPLAQNNDTNDVSIGNTTADLTSERILESTGDHTTRRSAERVYQGSPILFYADRGEANGADNVPVLLENIETGEILLDGSTGANSNQIAFDSDNLESGTTYELLFDEDGQALEYENGYEEKKYINVTSLRLSASLDQDGTLFEHDEDVNLDIEGDAIRGNSDLAIEVRDEDGGLVAVYQDRLNNRAEFDFSASIGQQNIGADDETTDYTVSVIDVETGVSVEAGSFSVDSFPDADSASFQGGVFEEERGDVVEIPITLRNSEEGAQAHLSVGSLGDTNYVTNVTVADMNGDGEVTVLFNSYMAGTQNMSAVFSAAGPDTVDVWRNENGTFIDEIQQRANDNNVNNNLSRARIATLDAASYELQVAAAQQGDDFQNFTFADNEADDVGAIDLGTRSTESSTIWRVPDSKANSLSLNFIDESTDSTVDEIDGNLTQTDRVTNREVIIHQVAATGIEGILYNQTRPEDDVSFAANDSMAFLRELQNGNDYALPQAAFDAGFETTNPKPNEPLRQFDLETTNDFVFLPDYQNDTYYIAVRISEVDQDKLRDNDNWNASFTFSSYDAVGPVLGGSGGGGVSSDWTYELADAELNLVNGRVEVRNLEGQTMTGQTNVAPGTLLNVQIQSESDNSPFLIRPTTRVQEGNGTNQLPNTFTVTEDFSTRSAGINFTAVVRRGTTALSDEYDGRLLGRPTASVTINDQSVSSEVETQGVTVASVTLSDGGFIAIHQGGAGGPVIGASSYREAGTHQNVRIALESNLEEGATLVAMPHLDTDGDNVYEFAGGSLDAPYTTMDGAPVTDSASVEVVVDTPVPTDTPTDTPTPTATPTPTDTPEPATPTDTPEPSTPTATDEPDTPTPTTTSTGPGFGVIVAVIALLAAALLAARRRD